MTQSKTVNNGFAISRPLVSFLCALCVLCGSISAQDFKTIKDGVEHAAVNYKLGTEPVKINLIRLDLTKVRLDVHHAMDAAIGTEKTSSIATRYSAVAAINAEFFRLDTSIWAGDAAGVLQIDGRLLSESNGMRIELLLGNKPKKTEVFMERLCLVQNVMIGEEILKAIGINRERKTDDIVLFTPQFSRTTKTNSDGLEIVIVQNRIIEIRDRAGDSAIPRNGYVLSASGKQREKLINLVLKNRLVRLSTLGCAISNETYLSLITDKNAWDYVGGVPQLIKDGKIDITWEQEKASKSFVETRHPRTAVAKMKDGKFLMVTVDGRRPGVSVGMSLYELAEYLLSIGAVDAMNLDGGGSTTMFLDGKVVNTPSDKEGERKVGDAILVTLRKKSK